MKSNEENFASLLEVHRTVSKGHNFFPDINIMDYLYRSPDNSQVLVKQQSDTLEIALCINDKVLDEIQKLNLPAEFDLNEFSALSVAIEELSHFNSLYWKALHDESISALELETQAEVDKFSVALDWLERTNQENLREKVFDILFSELKVGSWIQPADEKIYEEAHLLAKNFCRRLLKEKFSTQERLQIISEFFRMGGSRKLSFSF